MAETLKEAIITLDKKIKCPICNKTNGLLNKEAVIKDYKIRCRGSRRGAEHFFILNSGGDEKQ